MFATSSNSQQVVHAHRGERKPCRASEQTTINSPKDPRKPNSWIRLTLSRNTAPGATVAARNASNKTTESLTDVSQPVGYNERNARRNAKATVRYDDRFAVAKQQFGRYCASRENVLPGWEPLDDPRCGPTSKRGCQQPEKKSR